MGWPGTARDAPPLHPHIRLWHFVSAETNLGSSQRHNILFNERSSLSDPSLKNKPAREQAGRQTQMFVQTLISSRTFPLGLCNVCWMVYVGVGGGPVGCIMGASRRRMCSARLLSADSQDEPKDAAQPGCYFGLIYL